MVFIYVLQLEDKKYYVGKTTNPSFRLEKHFSSSGSVWTKKYTPISLLELIPNCDDYDEDKYTIKYMEKYGINNVRGGSFCEIKLSDDNIMTLKQMIKGVTDKCYICGKNDHFAIDCKKVCVKKEKKPTINLNEKCDCPTSYFSSHRRGKCMLNNIISYFEDEDDDIDKLLIDDDDDDGNKDSDNNKEDKEAKPNNCCFRCGRKGHYVSSCYASTHIKGYALK
jgi:hypothetical protein